MHPRRHPAKLALGLCALVPATAAHAAVIDTQWVQVGPTEVWLYASVDPDTEILNADLGDTSIDLAPDGVNNGLYSSNGTILNSSGGTIDPRDGGLFASRIITLLPSGTGTRFDGAWFTDDAAPPALVDLGNGPTPASLLLKIDLETTTTIVGGPNGGPVGAIQSRIFIGWEDPTTGAGFGVFDIPQIPSPGAALLAPALALTPRRRRR